MRKTGSSSTGTGRSWEKATTVAGGRRLPASWRPVSIDDWARIVWDYHHVGHALAKADCIIVLGSHDTRVAERGAEVFLGGWAPLLVCSGHLGALTRAMWTRSEAEIFADVAVSLGVPRDRVLIEARSTNTGENVDFSRRSAGREGPAPAEGDRRPEALHGATDARDLPAALAGARGRGHLATGRTSTPTRRGTSARTTSSTSWWGTCRG